MSDPFPCWDNEHDVGYAQHDYGEYGTNASCTHCGYEVELCAVAVYTESYEYGGEWTGCDIEVRWWGQTGKRKPIPLCDSHKQEKATADPAMTFTGYDPATAERTWVHIDDLCTLPVCHHADDEDCSTRQLAWFLAADL